MWNPRARRRCILLLLFRAPGAEPILRRRRNPPDAALWDFDSTGTIGLSPPCSFEVFEEGYENITLPPTAKHREVRFPRGRYEPTRSYIGLKMWSSRGDMDPRKAVLAMLGDPHAFYETPMFTAFKLFALGRIHKLSRVVYRSGGEGGWQEDGQPNGYDGFWRGATARAFDAAYVGRFPTAADEAEAVELAAALVDDFFAAAPPDEFRQLYLDGWLSEDPYFVSFSMMNYRKAVMQYGDDGRDRALLALAPPARRRALDNGFFKTAAWWDGELRFKGRDPRPIAAAGALAWGAPFVNPDMCDCMDDDFAELMTPGYQRPEDVLGIEWGRWGRHFYKVCFRGAHYVAVLRAGAECVTQEVGLLEQEEDEEEGALGARRRRRLAGWQEDNSGGGADRGRMETGENSAPFFFCHDMWCTDDEEYCGVTPVILRRPPVPVPVVGVFYTAPRDGSSEDDGGGDNTDARAARQRAGEDALTLFVALNDGQKEPLPLAVEGTWGDVPASPGWPPPFLVSLLELRFIGGEELEVRAVLAAGDDGVGIVGGGPLLEDVSLGLSVDDDDGRPSVAAILHTRRGQAPVR